jgi:hypothetical protein
VPRFGKIFRRSFFLSGAQSGHIATDADLSRDDTLATMQTRLLAATAALLVAETPQAMTHALFVQVAEEAYDGNR